MGSPSWQGRKNGKGRKKKTYYSQFSCKLETEHMLWKRSMCLYINGRGINKMIDSYCHCLCHMCLLVMGIRDQVKHEFIGNRIVSLIPLYFLFHFPPFTLNLSQLGWEFRIIRHLHISITYHWKTTVPWAMLFTYEVLILTRGHQ